MSDTDIYRLYFEQANQGFAITAPDTRWMEVNAALCRMLGYTEAELRRLTWVDLTHPDDRASDLREFRRLLAGAIDGYQLDKRFLRKDGSVLHARLTVACARDGGGRVRQVIATLLDRSEEHRLIEALTLSEERFRLLADSTLDGIWDWDLKAGTLWLSPSWKAQLGYTDDELRNHFDTWSGRLHPEDHSGVMDHLQGFLADPAEIWQETFRLRHKDGSWRRMMARAIAVLDAEHRVHRMLGVHVDITEERRAVEQLKAWSRDLELVLKVRSRELAESEARYRNIADHTFDWEIWTDADGELRYCSPACERISGYPPTAFAEEPALMSAIVEPDDRPAWDRYLAALRAARPDAPAQTSLSYRIRRRDGEIRWLERFDRTMTTDEGAFAGLRGSIRDITEIRVAQRELERQKTFVEAVFGTARAMILVLSPTAEVVRVNAHVEAVTGWRPEELVGRNWIEVSVPPQDRARIYALFERAFYRERTSGLVTAIQTKQGALRQLCWYDEVLADEQGQPGLLVTVGIDVTEQLATEEALRRLNDELEQKVAERTRELTLATAAMVQTEKLSSLGTLVAGLAHEINNPLMGLGNYVQYARDHSDGRVRELLGKADHEIGRIAGIVDNLLQYARPADDAGSEAVDLIAVARRAAELVAAELRRCRIVLYDRLPAGLPAVQADAAALQQVLLNLLINARDALDARCAAGTSREGAAPPWIALEAGTVSGAGGQIDRVWIAVIDNGVGVPAELRGRIFDPFVSTKPRGAGTGLGLSVSDGIVRGFGGSLTLVSTGAGSTSFRVELHPVPTDAGIHV